MSSTKLTSTALLAAMQILLLSGFAFAETTIQPPRSAGANREREALGGKLGEIGSLLESIEANLGQATLLQRRLDEQNAGLADAVGEAEAGAEEQSGQLEEALRLFKEKVAPLIATKVAQAVSQELEGYINAGTERAVEDLGAGSEDLAGSLEEIAASLGAATEAVAQAKDLAQAMLEACKPPDS